MITMGFGPRYPGGAEHQAELLARALARRGRRITIYAPMVSTDRSSVVDRPEGLRVISVPCLGLPRTRTATYLPMLGLIQVAPGFDHPAILHTHMAWYHALVPELAKRVTGARTIVKFACSGPDGEIATLSRTSLGRQALRVILGADRIVALTDAVARELLESGVPEARIGRIPNGVETNVVADPAPDLLQHPGPRVLFAGRLSRQKGILPFMDAWATVIHDLPGAMLFVAGVGELETDIQSRALRTDLRNHVRILGHRTDMPNLLAAVDAVVLPSRSEGMSNVALEALAQGRPLFGFAIPGIEEVVRDERALAPVGDYTTLVRRLAGGLKDRMLLEELGTSGRAIVHAHYAIDRIAGLYEEVYNELLA